MRHTRAPNRKECLRGCYLWVLTFVLLEKRWTVYLDNKSPRTRVFFLLKESKMVKVGNLKLHKNIISFGLKNIKSMNTFQIYNIYITANTLIYLNCLKHMFNISLNYIVCIIFLLSIQHLYSYMHRHNNKNLRQHSSGT